MAVHFGNTPRAVRSPCVSTCKMDPATGWCTGCYRTIDEIANWGSMPPEVKQHVWLELGRRRQGAAKKPDGTT